jgi:hypothetical protein
MSTENFLHFYKEVFRNEELREEFRVVTSIQETVRLGQRHGYRFGEADAHEAMILYGEEIAKVVLATRGPSSAPPGTRRTHAYHYEFRMEEIAGFEEVAAQLGRLKIKPSTVHLAAFNRQFRQEDLDSTSLSPASCEFSRTNDQIMTSLRTAPPSTREVGYAQREAHLINLDLNVEHRAYDDFFQAKVKMVRLLKEFFNDDVKFSGALWYPPNAYRLWHTNENQPGWRMYITDFDKPPQGKSFFRYMHPQTKQLVTLQERSTLVRFFRVESRKQYLFWHCIANTSTANRWSFGFVVPESWMKKFQVS